MKTVICGLWHVHAADYYKKAIEYTDLIGVYDEDPNRVAEFCSKYPAKAFKSFEELLESGADAAIVCTSTDTHAETIIALAKAKMDIFTEKVLALTSADCVRIEKAIKKNKVKFVISLPHKYSAGAITAKKIIDSGELGKINFFRYRNVHNGSLATWLPAHFYNAKQCGGGAMIDLGAHGMYMADWLLGMPSAAKSTFLLSCEREEAIAKNIDKVEDNAVTVMSYDNGCIAINETGFVSWGCPVILEIGGENGRLVLEGSKLYATINPSKEPQELELEEGQPIPIVQFCTGKILEGCGIQEAKNLTKLMEMAYGK